MGSDYENLINYVVLKSSYVNELGLFHGKMGIVLSLWLQARKTNDDVLEDYAWDLFQQIHDGVRPGMLLGLEHGLVGIGVGTTLLRKYGLIDCDLSDVLSDVDDRLMDHDPRRMTDLSVYSGAQGIKLYLQLRKDVDGTLGTFDKQYLVELRQALGESPAPSADSWQGLLHKPAFGIGEYVGKPLGIDRGSSFYLLKQAIP